MSPHSAEPVPKVLISRDSVSGSDRLSAISSEGCCVSSEDGGRAGDWVARNKERELGGERRSVASDELGLVESAERPMANPALEWRSGRSGC